MTIKPIPEDKRLTTYELAQTLEAVAKCLRDLPLSIVRNVEDEQQIAYQNIEAIIKGVNSRLVNLETALTESEDALIQATDAHYEKTSKAIRGLNDKLRTLPKIDSVSLPYNLDKILETAERLAEMPDEQWARFIELAKVLR